jgi:hypothetical protein
VTSKPPLPAGLFDSWPRVEIDEGDGSPFARLVRTGSGAANAWILGPDGPYAKPGMPMAEIIRAAVRESLLHLLELGLLDIDVERLEAAKGYPGGRSDFRDDGAVSAAGGDVPAATPATPLDR